jgi:hypothetical protein
VSTLLVQMLNSELSQEFRLNIDKRYIIAGLYPYLYMHNAPAGTFTFSVLRGEDELISQDFTCSDIKTSLNTTDNYAHVFFPILPEDDLWVLDKGDYTAKISASGYSATSSSFLGWIREYENPGELDYVPESDAELPMSLRAKILRNQNE